MPIPTDTFWNIKRLNIVFAASALLLMAVTGWSILQDYAQRWREPQRDAKVWQAAFVEERIQRDNTPELKAELDRLGEQRKDLVKQYGPDTPETKRLTGELRKLESDQANMEFALNTLKAEV